MSENITFSVSGSETYYHKDWLKSKEDPPKELTNKTDICMLIDNGYTLEGDILSWSIQEGSIQLQAFGDSWKITFDSAEISLE